MHETSIARNLISLAEGVAREHPGRPLAVVRVRIGVFQSVVPDALAFAFDALKPGTACAGASLELVDVPLVVRCESCGEQERTLDSFTPFCVQCGSVATVVSGTELELDSVDFGTEDISADPPGWEPASPRTMPA